MPTAVAPPKQLAAALAHALGRRVPKKRRVLIEVVLIDGVNDAEEHANQIADLLQPIHAVCQQVGCTLYFIHRTLYNKVF